MKLTELTFSDAQPVDGYGPGFFRVAGEIFEGPVTVHAQGVQPWGGFEDAESLIALRGELDFVLVGMGADMRPVPKDFREAMEAAGLGVEPMQTPTACRTYNVLASEGRRVAVALIPV